MRPESSSEDDLIAAQAAEWIVALTSGDEAESADARIAFEVWKRADPRHAAAAAGLERFIGQMQAARDQTGGSARPARAALDAAFARDVRRQRLRRAGASLVLACVLAVPAFAVLQRWPVSYLVADIRTGTGQWETQILSDGTRVVLNGSSAVNLRYDEQRRAIELVKGEILVEVAHDADRPFVVETVDGQIRALGTRFVVARDGAATVLSMLESRVAVQTASELNAHSSDAVIVEAGYRVRITPDAVSAAERIDADALGSAWGQRQLLVRDQSMAEVLDELARHDKRIIHYDRAQLEGMCVDALLPLDDAWQALQLLQASFPRLRVRSVTPWVILVDAPPL